MTQNLQKKRREEVLEKLDNFLNKRGAVYGLAALGCFGSVARREAYADSDVDVVYRIRPGTKLTLFDLALVRDELVERLGCPVDLIELREGMPARLRARVEQEAAYA
ncbi:MAG: nucleotidyltransferase domain-containing protein [Desulfococcaceae bacterium]|jgi:predicted nucleotidyltransferase|nr:nucleotidyltransferase domain-containing protein [Desulfococcaceae bacterium]